MCIPQDRPCHVINHRWPEKDKRPVACKWFLEGVLPLDKGLEKLVRPMQDQEENLSADLESDVLRADVHSFRPTMANAIARLAEKASAGNAVQKPNASGGNHPRRNDH